MRFEAQALLAQPMLMMGVLALSFILVILALTRDWWRVLAGFVGAVTGYVLFGTELAYRFAESARAAHECPDAAWMGPAVGELPAAFVFVILFEAIRSIKTTNSNNRGTGDDVAG